METHLPDLRALIAQYGEEVNKNSDKAFMKTATWYRAQVFRAAQSELGLPREAIKSRWFKNKSNHFLWLGLNHIAVSKLGFPLQTPTGVKVGSKEYRHAFRLQKHVFRRVSRNRLPIEKVTEDYSVELGAIFTRLKGRAITYYIEKLQESLK